MARLVSRALVAKHFPTLAQMTYLNNASTGVPPATMVEAVDKYLQNRLNVKGSFDDTARMFVRLRAMMARLLGGKPDNYAFLPSTSDGLNSAAHSIEYPKGSNIVICDLEFPSNYIPWQHVSQLYGPELRVVRSENGAAPTEKYLQMIDGNTRVVAVSHVQFSSGYRSDLLALARAVHEVGGILVTDVIQSAGCIDIDLVKSEVDFAAAQAAKWMLGPIGAGFLYVSDKIMDLVTPRFMGWWGVENMDDFSYQDRKMLSDARKFQTGSLPIMPYVGLEPVLRLLNRIPGEARMDTAMDRANYLRKRLSEAGVEYYDFGRSHCSPIVSCAPPNTDRLQKTLARNRIYCSVRSGRLRVSPHFYNSRADIDRLMTYLE